MNNSIPIVEPCSDNNYKVQYITFDQSTGLVVKDFGNEIQISSDGQKIKRIVSNSNILQVFHAPSYNGDDIHLNLDLDENILKEMIEEYKQEKILRENHPELNKMYKDYKMYAKLVRQHLDKDEE